MRDVIRAYEAALKEVLTQAGWKRRTGGLFTKPVQGDCLAWLGINRATKYWPLHVNPVVGVHHPQVESVRRALLPPLPKPTYVGATYAIPVGYLTPAKTYLTLDVPSSAEAPTVAAETAALAETYAVPLATRLADLEALSGALAEGPLTQAHAPPIVLALLGRRDEALAMVASMLEEAGETLPGSPFRVQQEHFAAEFERWLNER